MSVLIGIDLGTSTTEAAVYRDGQPEMILNLNGEAITPSAVGIDEDGNWVAGTRAKAQYIPEPERTVIEVKRLTGTGARIPLGKAEYTAPELQAKLLSYVRQYASSHLGENVDRAVISVPAYFDHIQRAETIQAGELAGFSVERIVNEPTAAAMSYGLDHLEEESHVLVYDLGGGTFDVTLLEMFGGVLEVKASSGVNQLGGKDFDERLMEELFSRFRSKHHVDLKKDRSALARIKTAAENSKIELSSRMSSRVRIPAACVIDGKPEEIDETISRELFENLTKDLLEKTHAPLEQVLRDAGIGKADIDHVILVGGSTRMPMVARDIREFFGKEPLSAVHPDYAVAMGAAILGGIISGEVDAEDSLVMTDVCAFSMGVRAQYGEDNYDHMSVIIPRNTTIPVSRTEEYHTSGKAQTKARIEVYQGESRFASENHYLGNLMIDEIPSGPKGREAIRVTFSYDLNGMLKVNAEIPSNGRKNNMEIDLRKASTPADLSEWKNAEGAKKYRVLIRRAERIAGLTGDKTGMLESDIRYNLNRLKEAIILGDAKKAETLSEELTRMVVRVKPGD